MANKTEQMVGVFLDLDIDYTDWQENPKEFAKRLRDAANKLDVQLKEKNSLLDMEERFKAKATNSPEANAQAEEFINSIMDQIMEMPPEVMACVLTRLPEVSKSIAMTIRNVSMRQEKAYSKRRIHLMYNRLRKAYEVYVGFMQTFRADEIGKPPMIPARPGNYGNDLYAVKEYIFFIDGADFLNYYTAARILGVEIQHYMDLVDRFTVAINEAKEEGKRQGTEVPAMINGHEISMVVVGDEEE